MKQVIIGMSLQNMKDQVLHIVRPGHLKRRFKKNKNDNLNLILLWHITFRKEKGFKIFSLLKKFLSLTNHVL